MSEATWHDVAAEIDLAPDDVVGVHVAGFPIALFRLDDGLYALHDLCSHGMARLSDGYVDGDCIECPLHQGLIAIRDGAARSAPVVDPVRSYPVRVVNGRVEVLTPATTRS